MGGPVVVLGATGLRWDDVDPQRTPALAGLRDSAGVADVSIRNVRTTACPIDGWLALSAGRRAADAPRGSAEPLCRTAGEPVRQGKTAVLESFSTYSELAAEGTFGAVPGTLGDLLREERVSVSAIGPGAAIAAWAPTARSSATTRAVRATPRRWRGCSSRGCCATTCSWSTSAASATRRTSARRTRTGSRAAGSTRWPGSRPGWPPCSTCCRRTRPS